MFSRARTQAEINSSHLAGQRPKTDHVLDGNALFLKFTDAQTWPHQRDRADHRIHDYHPGKRASTIGEDFRRNDGPAAK